MSCAENEHHYQFAGVVWSEGRHQRPGSSARDLVYEDKFFCQKCLDTQYRNARVFGSTYSDRLPGALPK